MRFLPFLLLFACSSISTNYDYDTSYDFAKLKSYRWVPSRVEANPLIVQRVDAAVEAQLKAKGYVLAGGQADFLVAAHVGRQSKIQVTDWGYGYGPRAAWYGGGHVDVYQYEEGSLIVDIIDARTKQLEWRGTATAVIDPGATPEQRTEKIDEAVSKMFKDFPPPKK